MAIQIRLTDNADRIQTRLSGNIHAALTAMGLKGVELTVNQMQTGYGRPIWQTGDLQRDVNFEKTPWTWETAWNTAPTFTRAPTKWPPGPTCGTL